MKRVAIAVAAALLLAGCSTTDPITDAAADIAIDVVTEARSADADRALAFASRGCVNFLDVETSVEFSDESVLRSITGPFVEAALLDGKWRHLVDDAAFLPVLGMNAQEGSPRIGTLESFTAYERLTSYCDVLAAKGDGGSD